MGRERYSILTDIDQIGRDCALAYVKGKGPWKAEEIKLPDDDYAVQHFIDCARKVAAYCKWNEHYD